MISPLASPFRGGFRNLTPMRGRGRGGVAWSPANLAPYAWYDANIGGSSTQITDSSGNGRAAATFGATTAAPTWLPYTTPAVYLTGAASSYISTPDSAALSFSNDIEVVCRIKPVDWSAAANQTIVGKYLATGNQRSWRFYASTAGAIAMSVSQDGTSTVTTVTVTPSVALTDNAWVWLRLRLDLTNGSNSVGTVETAADTGSNEDVPTVWTANGTATSTTIATVFDSTAALEIGSFTAGATERLNGWIGRMIVRNGFAGTSVADFNATLCGQSGYTDSLTNVWTVNRPTSGLKTVVQSPTAGSVRSMLLLATDDLLSIPAAAQPPAAAANTWSLLAVTRTWATPTSFGRVFDSRSGAGAGLSILNLDTATSHYISLSDGAVTVDTASVAPAYTAGARVVFSVLVNATTNVVTYSNNTASTGVSTATVGARTGSLVPAYVGRSSGGNYNSFEFEALLTFDRVLTATEIARTVAYYGGGT